MSAVNESLKALSLYFHPTFITILKTVEFFPDCFDQVYNLKHLDASKCLKNYFLFKMLYPSITHKSDQIHL